MNFISDPVNSGVLSYGFRFYIPATGYVPSSLVEEGANIGGFGELKDSSKYGEYFKDAHYSDDKIVRARLDKDKGFAVYNKNTSEWVTVLPWSSMSQGDKNGGNNYDVMYRLDLSAKTFNVTVADTSGNTIGTATGIPFNITDYTAIDAIEFNTMDYNTKDAEGNTYQRTSNYTLMNIFMQTLETYTVTFYNGDGTVIETQSVEGGVSATAPVAVPQKSEDEKYVYEFKEWNTDFSNVTSDLAVYPVFKTYPKETDTAVDAYYNFYNDPYYTLLKEANENYGESSSYKVLTGGSAGSYTYATSPVSKVASGGTFYGSAAIVSSASDENTVIKAIEPAYSGLQADSGFKNVTMYISGTGLNNYFYQKWGNFGLTWLGYNTNALDNINFISAPVKKGLMEYGFTFRLPNLSQAAMVSSTATNIGGFGELKDTSVNGEYIGAVHYTDDKIVRARLDQSCGFAVYNKNTGEWVTVVPWGSFAANTNYDVVYRVDLSAKTFDVKVLSGETVAGTATDIPFNITDYHSIDAIEFNAMSKTGEYGQTSNYYIMNVYMNELVPDAITEEYNAKGAGRILQEEETVTVFDGAILKNATIDATLGSVEIGDSTVSGYMQFNETGQLDAVAGKGAVRLISPEKEGAVYNDKVMTGNVYGFIEKSELVGTESGYSMILQAVGEGEYGGNTVTVPFDFEGVLYEGVARFRVIVRGVPEAYDIVRK